MLTEEWTQGCVVALPRRRSVGELVRFVIEQNRADLLHVVKVDNVAREFSLPLFDAERAIHRVAGGILFAVFGHEAPSRSSDPIAHASYRLTIERRLT